MPVDDLQVSNAEFVSVVFNTIPDNASALVCSKIGDPSEGGWSPVPADRLAEPLPVTANNYLNCASFYRDQDGAFKARKANFAAIHFIMLDDIGSKVPIERLGEFQPSWFIETSSGNYQAGILLDPPIVSAEQAAQLLTAIISVGLCDRGATGPATRWARLPQAVNGKPQHRAGSGEPFKCRLVKWEPQRRYSISEIVEGLGLPLLGTVGHVATRQQDDDEVPEHKPLVSQLKALLAVIEPDCEYQDWLNALMAIYHATDGSDEGLALADQWSSAGSKYTGPKELEIKWRSFKGTSRNLPDCVTSR